MSIELLNPPPLALAPPLQVTIAEAARLLGFKPRTIRLLCQRGELRRVGSGRLTRIDYASIVAYHERQKRLAA